MVFLTKHSFKQLLLWHTDYEAVVKIKHRLAGSTDAERCHQHLWEPCRSQFNWNRLRWWLSSINWQKSLARQPKRNCKKTNKQKRKKLWIELCLKHAWLRQTLFNAPVTELLFIIGEWTAGQVLSTFYMVFIPTNFQVFSYWIILYILFPLIYFTRLFYLFQVFNLIFNFFFLVQYPWRCCFRPSKIGIYMNFLILIIIYPQIVHRYKFGAICIFWVIICWTLICRYVQKFPIHSSATH